MVTRTIRFLVAAAAAISGAALAQLAREPRPTEAEQSLLERIDRVQAEEGIAAEALIEPLRALALVYQEAGDHVQAVVALQQARQVMRSNRGLFSATVDEALLLRQQIASEKALGYGDRVWNLQHDMETIAMQHLDDVRMLPIFLELVDDSTERFDVYSTTDFGDLPPGIYVPCDPVSLPPSGDLRSPPVPVTDARNCEFGTYRMVVARLRSEVLRHYAEAITVIIRSGDYASQELRDLEREALRIVPHQRFVVCSVGTFGEFLASDLPGSCMDPLVGAGVGGWASLMRLIFYEVRSGGPAAARASAFAELGDWYLLTFASSRDGPGAEMARKLYEQALVELRPSNDAPASMAEIFSPELPVTLPTNAPNPLASRESSRFIDVEFAITKDGLAEQIEILDSGENATRGEEKDLVGLIELTRFRPRAAGGVLADSARVVVRYYLPAVAGARRPPIPR